MYETAATGYCRAAVVQVPRQGDVYVLQGDIPPHTRAVVPEGKQLRLGVLILVGGGCSGI